MSKCQHSSYREVARDGMTGKVTRWCEFCGSLLVGYAEGAMETFKPSGVMGLWDAPDAIANERETGRTR